MKSWRFTGTNEPLQLAELPEPTAGPGQVVVDVKAAGICHTDVGILTDPGWMTMLAQVPVTLGHEDAGVISQVGEGVDDFQVGDRVAICPTTPAGCPGSSFDGGFGPKIVVGTQALVRIPDEVDFVNGAAATDAGMPSYAAVVCRGGVKAGDRVGIIGLAGWARSAPAWPICWVPRCMWRRSRRISGRWPRNWVRWTRAGPSRTIRRDSSM